MRPASHSPSSARAPAAEGHEPRAAHWERAYAGRDPRAASWFQDEAHPSLDLVTDAAASPACAVLDMGGGASTLAGHLLDRGFGNVTVVDMSPSALESARARLGSRAVRISWLAADATTWTPPRLYDVWHDRAAFHFLVDPQDRAAYLHRLRAAVPPGGRVVMGTFAPDGPETCSGLPVMRYDAPALATAFGPQFTLLRHMRHDHVTPGGKVQSFQFCTFLRRD